jgi:large subunit ribosomal protein L10
MEATSLDEEAFKAIAKLPTREVLNGQLAGVIASPLTGLVRGLGALIGGLALQLGQIAEQGLVTGEAPAAAPAPAEEAEEAPADDAPAEDEKADDAPAAEADAPADEAPAEEPKAEDEAPAETDQDSNEEEE